jgi:hypothetical protein
MIDKDRKLMLASCAMWSRDYEKALGFYKEFLASENYPDVLTLYRIYFDLTIANAILRKPDVASSYQEKLEGYIERIKTHYASEKKRELSIAKIRFRIMNETDPIKMRRLLEMYFPNNEDMLGFFMSRRYAKGFLNRAIRNAMESKLPKVFQDGIFRYTLDSELYRVIAHAYSVQELELEKLVNAESNKILIKTPEVYYVENEKLRIIASIQSEGLVLCQYFLRDSQDITGSQQIHEFLTSISGIFER